MKTYAIGDIYGLANLLEALLSFVDRENTSPRPTLSRHLPG